jgi:hypothetical protein
MDREKPRPGRAAAADLLDKDPAEMSDAELETAIEEMEAIRVAALADPEHPMHREISALRPDAFRRANNTVNAR